MNKNECLNELMSYGYTLEEACKYHKAICKQQTLMLADFRVDLQLKLDSEKAKEVYDRLTTNWEDYGISHLHSLCYSILGNTMRNATKEENESVYNYIKSISKPTGRKIKL